MAMAAMAHAAAAAASQQYTSDMGGALACRGDCGTRDTTNQYSAVVRLCMVEAGENPNDRLCEGSTTTFIEDDVVAGEAHVLGFGQDSGSWTPCCECGSAVSNSESADLNEGKEFYLAAGDDTRTLAATRIIGKLTHYGVRATGNPPGYDLFVAKVDRACAYCVDPSTVAITPIPLARSYPHVGAPAVWVYTAGTGDKDGDATWPGRDYAYRQVAPHKLDRTVGSVSPPPPSPTTSQPCRRQPVLMDGVVNPLVVSDTSGSPVIISECGTDAVHGFHGNGEGYPWCTDAEVDAGYMCEILQLVQSQRSWVLAKVTEWTGRTALLDACAGTATAEATVGYSVEQYGCESGSPDDAEFGIDGGDSGDKVFTACDEVGSAPAPSPPPVHPGDQYDCVFLRGETVISSGLEDSVVDVRLQRTEEGLSNQQREIQNFGIFGTEVATSGCTLLVDTIRNAEGTNTSTSTLFLKAFEYVGAQRVSLTRAIYFSVQMAQGASECTVTMKGNEFRWSGEGGSVSNREKSFSLTVTAPSPPSASPSPPPPPPAPSPSPSSPSPPSAPAAELNVGAIVGGAVGGVFGAVFCSAFVYWFVKIKPNLKRAAPEA